MMSAVKKEKKKARVLSTEYFVCQDFLLPKFRPTVPTSVPLPAQRHCFSINSILGELVSWVIQRMGEIAMRLRKVIALGGPEYPAILFLSPFGPGG